MDSLTRLQILNLFKKYDYFLTEYQFKNEISLVSHNLFQENVKKVLSSLKNETENNLNESSKEQPDNNITKENSIEEIKIDPLIKSLYRKIAKVTHPDKISNSYLNNLYIEATEAVENNNQLLIFKICMQLDIEFEPPENLTQLIDSEISSLQKKIIFLESSYHMKWHNSSKSEKNDILISYLKRSIKQFEV
jgi:hypothetical protein